MGTPATAAWGFRQDRRRSAGNGRAPILYTLRPMRARNSAALTGTPFPRPPRRVAEGRRHRGHDGERALKELLAKDRIQRKDRASCGIRVATSSKDEGGGLLSRRTSLSRAREVAALFGLVPMDDSLKLSKQTESNSFIQTCRPRTATCRGFKMETVSQGPIPPRTVGLPATASIL